MKPNEKAITHPNSGNRAKMLFNAANATERAITVSINREFKCTIFSAARLSVIECAMVKAVTIFSTEINVARKLELTSHAPVFQRKTDGSSKANKNKM